MVPDVSKKVSLYIEEFKVHEELEAWKMMVTRSSETSGSTYPVMQRLIPEDRILDYTVAKTSEMARVLMKFDFGVSKGNFSTYSNLGFSRKE
jgi:hypothetical protein